MDIRPSTSSDVHFMSKVADAAQLFPGEMLPDMISGYLAGGDNPDVWLTCELDEEAIGFCYAVPEKLTDGTWNMLAIAIHPDHQGKGIGAALVRQLEASLLAKGHRILIADTSGRSDFDLTREFYRKNGYSEEARIRDFWAVGDDKVVFWKSLTGANG